MTRVSLLCTALCLWCALAFPQAVDSVSYPEVRVEAYRIAQAVGTRHTDTDTALLHLMTHRDLSALLQLQGNIQVRSYGPGGIATFSMRGTTAGHTQVMWMGMPVNDPMLGVSDLGTLPLNGLGGVRLLHGAAAMPHHSGGIGGTIELVEEGPLSKDGIAVGVQGEAAAFGTYSGGLNLKLRHRRLWANTAFNYLSATNDFTYNDLATIGRPEKRMEHAEVRQISVAQAIGFDIDPRNSLSAHLRHAETDRLLPATMLMSTTKETLFDRDVWLALRYARTGRVSALEVTSSYIYGKQEYLGNDDHLYDYLYQANRNIVRYGLRPHRKVQLKFGADITSEHARSDTAYRNTTGVWRHWQALFASVTYSPAPWMRGQALVREDLIDGRFSPVQALGGVEADALKWLRLSANVSRNFRAPTLNDLHWNPGGNPDLRSETGFSMEAGLKLHRHWKSFGGSLQADWYRNDVDNWILWTPGQGNIWSPRNMRRVLAQGVETALHLWAQAGPVRMGLHAEYQYTASVVQQSDLANDNAVGRQLIYVPLNSVRGHLTAHWKGLTLMYGVYWTGARFTASDNSASLPAFDVHWLSASYRLPIRKHALQLGGTIDNLFNQQYQMIAWRPMPGRAWRVSLAYTFGT
jgi:vitamin B12 transporter